MDRKRIPDSGDSLMTSHWHLEILVGVAIIQEYREESSGKRPERTGKVHTGYSYHNQIDRATELEYLYVYDRGTVID